jgi:nicotinic acid mononucleotide adenylyltransferase
MEEDVVNTENFLLVQKEEFYDRNFLKSFAKNPTLVIYIVEKNGRVIGRCTGWNYFKGVKNKKLAYETEFLFAENIEQAKQYIQTRGYKSVPILVGGALKNHIEKVENIRPQIELGMLLKYKQSYNQGAVLRILEEQEIHQICLIKDDKVEVTNTYTRDYLQGLQIPMKWLDTEGFFELLNSEEIEHTLIVDLESDDLRKRIRRFIWGSRIEVGYSRYLFLENFLNFLKSAECSDRYLEESIQGLCEQYRYVVAFGKGWSRYQERQNTREEMLIDITKCSRITYNPYLEAWEITTEYDMSHITMMLIKGIYLFENERYFVNGFLVLAYNVDFNIEYRMIQETAKRLQRLNEQGIRSYVVGMDAEYQTLWKYDIYALRDLLGNDQETNEDTEKEKQLFRTYTGYEGERLDQFVQECYGEKCENKPRRNPGRTELYYAYSRHSVHNRKNRKRIFLFGCCMFGGIMAEDVDTIASKLGELYPEYDVLSYNAGFYNLEEVFLYYGNFYRDDIVLIMPVVFNKIQNRLYEAYHIPVIDLKEVYETFPRLNENIWRGISASNHKIYQEIVRHLAQKMEFQKQDTHEDDMYSIRESADFLYQKEIQQYEHQGELEQYLNRLTKQEQKEEKNGAIVMNCNPFTLGHLYLVEVAARQVDCLYLFVVEEDKSFFKFADRIQMVKQGVKHLKNVVVIPSGKFMISAVTLPGYFEKEENKDQILDASEDLHIFSERIAPRLQIKKRFVGEEPRDPVTAQYNQQMKAILPNYGIEVEEIPRKEVKQEAISASRVRKYLKTKEWEKIKEIVPNTTYEYLRMGKYE